MRTEPQGCEGPGNEPRKVETQEHSAAVRQHLKTCHTHKEGFTPSWTREKREGK